MLICFWLQREMLNCPPGWAGRKLQQISVYFTAYLAICLLWEHVWAGQVRFRLGQLKLPHNGIIYLCLCQAGKAVVEEEGQGREQTKWTLSRLLLRYVTLHCVALRRVELRSLPLCHLHVDASSVRHDENNGAENVTGNGKDVCISVCVWYTYGQNPPWLQRDRVTGPRPLVHGPNVELLSA